MKCAICKHGELAPGFVTVTLERDRMTLVIKGVPAQVCSNCGEHYLDSATTAKLLQEAEQTAATGVEFEVRSFAA